MQHSDKDHDGYRRILVPHWGGLSEIANTESWVLIKNGETQEHLP